MKPTDQSEHHGPLVSIIVPTYNSASNLETFFRSFEKSSYKNFEIIINDDKRTADNTEDVVKSFAKSMKIIFLKKNRMMAQARKAGANHAAGTILVHLDSDMAVTENLIAECTSRINAGYDGLVIPEESYGTTFWAKCKWLEKKCYEGNEDIESLRCVRKEIYQAVGGHDEDMVFSEDKDFDIRVRKYGCKIGRTKAHLMHNEGNLKLYKTLRKKMGYSNTANVYAKKHPQEYKRQANVLRRYAIFAKNAAYALEHPLIYVGMVYMKTMEYAASAYGILIKRLKTNAA